MVGFNLDRLEDIKDAMDSMPLDVPGLDLGRDRHVREMIDERDRESELARQLSNNQGKSEYDFIEQAKPYDLTEKDKDLNDYVGKFSEEFLNSVYFRNVDNKQPRYDLSSGGIEGYGHADPSSYGFKGGNTNGYGDFGGKGDYLS